MGEGEGDGAARAYRRQRRAVVPLAPPQRLHPAHGGVQDVLRNHGPLHEAVAVPLVAQRLRAHCGGAP